MVHDRKSPIVALEGFHMTGTSSIKLNGFFGGTVVTILDIGPFFAHGEVFAGVGIGLKKSTQCSLNEQITLI